MKKYWKLLMLAAIVIFGTTLYFVQATKANRDYLSLTVETVFGDPALIENRVFYGTFNKGPIYQDTIATKDGSKNQLAGTYVSSLFQTYMPYSMVPYVEQYKSFMRGKIINPMSFFEDEQRLVYVEVNQEGGTPLTFTVDTLLKKEQKEHQFTVAALQSASFEYAAVDNVQLIDNALYIFVRTYSFEEKSQLYLYKLDMTKEEIVQSVHLTTPAMLNHSSYFNLYVGNHLIKQRKVFLGDITYDDVSSKNDGDEEQFTAYLIDVASMQPKKIEVPEALQYNSTSFYNTDDALYFLNWHEDVYTLYMLDYETETWTEVDLQTPNTIETTLFYIVDNIVYTGAYDEKDNLIYGFDLASGAHRFTGKVTNETNEQFTFSLLDVQ